MMDAIEKSKRDDLRILNLFAYTGGATMACAKAGANEVVHVDASKGMVQWAKENMHLSHLEDHKIRFIVDDVVKICQKRTTSGTNLSRHHFRSAKLWTRPETGVMEVGRSDL